MIDPNRYMPLPWDTQVALRLEDLERRLRKLIDVREEGEIDWRQIDWRVGKAK